MLGLWVNSSLHCYFRSHYKEYLVGLINKNKVDPVDIMGVQELERCFARRGKQAPKPRNENEGQYRKRLAQVTDNLLCYILKVKIRWCAMLNLG